MEAQLEQLTWGDNLKAASQRLAMEGAGEGSPTFGVRKSQILFLLLSLTLLCDLGKSHQFPLSQPQFPPPNYKLGEHIASLSRLLW